MARSITWDLTVDLFVTEYLVDLNATRAAVAVGYASSSAARSGMELLQRPEVIALIERRKAFITSKVDLQVADVVRQVVSVLRADPSEIVSYQKGACRYCHGVAHLYQSTAQEWRNSYQMHLNLHGIDGEPFDGLGGDGYNPKKGPHADCPECFGDGVPYVIARDVRDLSADAKQLYAGVKQTKYGPEIQLRSKNEVLQLAARYLGMDKVNMIMTNRVEDMTDDELMALIKKGT